MALINTTTTGILGTTVYGDGAGALTVQQDGVTINKVTKNPTFKAYLMSTQTIGVSNTWNKVNLDTKVFDTENCFNTSTSKFIPTVPGYYQINAGVRTWNGTAPYGAVGIYKNGNLVIQKTYPVFTTGYLECFASDVVYMNGTTDYMELYLYIYVQSGTFTIATGESTTWLSGSLVKAV